MHHEDILNLTYRNPKINEKMRAFKKTKSKRIKNKLYKTLFLECLEEKSVIILDDLVFMKPEIFSLLINNKEKIQKNSESKTSV